ncbi:glycosyltransferase [Methylorubrum extorquens]
MKKSAKSSSSFRNSVISFYSRISNRHSSRDVIKYFDREWYKAMYLQDKPDVDPVSHYLALSKTGVYDPHALFDSSYYIDRYPECLSYSKSVIEYFADVGISNNHSPNAFFDAAYYKLKYNDVATSLTDWFAHYINHGWKERRSTHPLFDHLWYVENNPDVARNGRDGLEHYLRSGIFEGRDPNILLDVDFLRRQANELVSDDENLVLRYHDEKSLWRLDPCEAFEVEAYCKSAGIDVENTHPLVHYITHGAYSFNPNSVFDTKFYTSHYNDIVSAGENPLSHYLKAGANEGRNPSRFFDTKWYRNTYPDVAQNKMNPLSHFLRFGQKEGRECTPSLATSAPPELVEPTPTLLSLVKGKAFLRSSSSICFPNHKAPVVSIILVLYNKYNLTLECLQSIFANVDYEVCPYEIIIYDNGSSDETTELKQRVSNVHWVVDQTNSGFIEGVNNAFTFVRCPLLLLLNNDTYVLHGSLERAVSLVESDSSIGAVGAKLILPSGRLQEAGSIIWNDGSCLGYCRDGSPDMSEANFQRDVDYVSGAFLLTRSDLFEKLGKLDEIYKPAYYEETDYCTKIRDVGLRVVYDPFVEIIHAEFGSADKKSNSIAQQEKNKVVFLRRNPGIASKLTPVQSNILKARFASSDRLKVLIIDDKVPHEFLGSGFPRSQKIIEQLSKADFDITFIPTNDSPQDWTLVRNAIDVKNEVLFGFDGDAILSHLRDRKDYYDAILVSRPHNMIRVRHALERNIINKDATFIVYDAEALFTYRDVMQSSIEGVYIDTNTVDSLVKAEVEISDDADLILSVSESESQIFRSHGKNVLLLGHSLQIAPTANTFAGRKDFLFVGSLADGNTPNTDSIIWFIEEILPRIVKVNPDCVLHLVGDIKSRRIESLLTSNIISHGRVNDVTPFYDKCKVFVAPTRFAAGIPHKVHEAAVHGIPCVVTNLLAKQLAWQNENELLSADSAEDFAAKCLALYGSEKMWETIRQNALEVVGKDCSPNRFASTVDTIARRIEVACQKKRTVARPAGAGPG